MFDSMILDVAIGLVFVYLVLSLIGTAANEFLASLLKRRATDLERGIGELLQDPSGVGGGGIVADLYKHPLIDSLFRGDIGGTGAQKAELPSYIPARSFTLALLDLIQRRSKETPSAASGTTPGPSTSASLAPASAGQVEALRASLDASPIFAANPELSRSLHALIDAAGDDIGQVRANVEGWFNSAMDRVSGWYKRRTQYIVLGLGLALAVLANADTFAIGDALARQKALREALVAGAGEYEKVVAPSSQTSRQWLEAKVAEVEPLGLPIGWRSGDLGVGSWLWARRVLGWLVTAFAISLGAPFWFDLLDKFMIVRSTVKPHQKSPEGPARD